MDVKKYINNAKKGGKDLWILNFLFGRGIPFNAPHKVKVLEVTDTSIKARFPYIRKNLNHVKGLHACGLAALSEFTAGTTLMSRIDFKQYRLIMSELKMEYFYQGKSDAIAEYSASDEWISTNIIKPLETQDSVYVECAVKVHDVQGNHLCTGTSKWQLKRWDKVKTKL